VYLGIKISVSGIKNFVVGDFAGKHEGFFYNCFKILDFFFYT